MEGALSIVGVSAAKPRVLVLIDRFTPSIGGAELMVQSVCKELHRRGSTVEVLTRNHTGNLATSEIIEGILVTRLGQGRTRVLSKLLFIPSAILRLIRSRKSYDVVHVHCCHAETDVLPAFVASLVTRRPFVAHMHGSMNARWMFRRRRDDPVLGSTRRNPLPRGFWKMALGAAAAVVTMDPVTEQILADVDLTNLRWVPNGIPVRSKPAGPVDRRAARARLGLPASAHIVVFAGVLRTSKNVMTLLRAWDLLCNGSHDRPVHLVILGAAASPSDSNEEELRQFVADRALDSVTFAGFVSNVEEYLVAADCFAFPSLVEGMSIALLEAMSVGTPVVVSDIPPNRQLVPSDEYGLIFDPTDHGALAEKLKLVLADPELAARLGTRAHSRVREQFLFERTVEQLEDLLEKITPAEGLDPVPDATPSVPHPVRRRSDPGPVR